MTSPYTRFLDWLFGPRDWAVVRFDGVTFAIHESRIDADDLIIRAGLRRGAALRIARHLRQKAEDTPEAVI
ncbi:MAG: hypothetical protein ACOY4K_00700 [Pseudomonadota bacterium]